MVQRTVTNGLVDYYKWLGGLTKKVWRVSTDGKSLIANGRGA